MTQLLVPATIPSNPASEPARSSGAGRRDADPEFAELVRDAESAAASDADDRHVTRAADGDPDEDPARLPHAEPTEATVEPAEAPTGAGPAPRPPAEPAAPVAPAPAANLPAEAEAAADPSVEARTAPPSPQVAGPGPDADPVPRPLTGPGAASPDPISPNRSPSLPAGPVEATANQVAATLPSAAPRGGAGPTVDSLDAVPPGFASGAAAAGSPAEATASPAPPAAVREGLAPQSHAADEPWQQVARALAPGRPTVDGTHRMTLRLHPRELGFVHVDLTLRDGDMRVRLLTETDSARDAMLTTVDQLRRELGTTGVGSTSVEIESRSERGPTGGLLRDPGYGSEADRRADGGEPGSPDRPQTPDQAEPAADLPTLDPTAVPSPEAQGLVVDL